MKHNKTNKTMTTLEAAKLTYCNYDPILKRIRIYLQDYDGSKTNRTEVRYYSSLAEALQSPGIWKVELA